MPAISLKGETLPASPIRKLAPFAEIAKKMGKKVYHLNIGQPDIETPLEMIDAIKNIDFKIWAYTPSEGIFSYRNKLTHYYNALGYGITPEHIMVTNGGSEAITIAMNVCFDPGDEIIIPEPFYANYNGFAAMAGVTVVPVVSTIENSFQLPPIAEIEALITPRTKAIFICSPNNPTGYVYTAKEISTLVEMVKKHDLFLFADEAYREFCYDGHAFVSPMQTAGTEKNVVVLDTVSKRYSACGARIGALITKNQEVLAAALKFGQTRLSPPLIGQIASEAALDTPPSYFKAVNREYLERRNLIVSSLNEMPGVFCPEPGGAFYVMARMPIDDADTFCRWLLEKFSWNGSTVMMAPGAGFYAKPGRGKDEVRIAYVLNKEDLTVAMTCIAEALQVYPGVVRAVEMA